MKLIDPAKLAAQGRLVGGNEILGAELWADWLIWDRNVGEHAGEVRLLVGGVGVLLLMREELRLGEKEGIDLVGGVGGGDGGVGALLRGSCVGG